MRLAGSHQLCLIFRLNNVPYMVTSDTPSVADGSRWAPWRVGGSYHSLTLLWKFISTSRSAKQDGLEHLPREMKGCAGRHCYLHGPVGGAAVRGGHMLDTFV